MGNTIFVSDEIFRKANQYGSTLEQLVSDPKEQWFLGHLESSEKTKDGYPVYTNFYLTDEPKPKSSPIFYYAVSSECSLTAEELAKKSSTDSIVVEFYKNNEPKAYLLKPNGTSNEIKLSVVKGKSPQFEITSETITPLLEYLSKRRVISESEKEKYISSLNPKESSENYQTNNYKTFDEKLAKLDSLISKISQVANERDTIERRFQELKGEIESTFSDAYAILENKVEQLNLQLQSFLDKGKRYSLKTLVTREDSMQDKIIKATARLLLKQYRLSDPADLADDLVLEIQDELPPEVTPMTRWSDICQAIEFLYSRNIDFDRDEKLKLEKIVQWVKANKELNRYYPDLQAEIVFAIQRAYSPERAKQFMKRIGKKKQSKVRKILGRLKKIKDKIKH